MFVSSTFHAREIRAEGQEDKTLRYYPMSYGMATRLHTLGAGFAKLLHALFTSDGTEASALRQEQAIAKLFETLYADRRLAAELVVDSLRDEFPRAKRKPAEVDDFLREVDAPSMVEHLHAVWQANKEAFRPLVGGLVEAVFASRATVAGLREGLSATPGASS